MDSKTQQTIEAVVLEILGSANLEEMTEYKVRSLAADRLGIDLSLSDRKRFVRRIVESFLASQKKDAANTAQEERQEEIPAAKGEKGGKKEEEEEEEEEEKEEEEVEDDLRRSLGAKEYDDEGNLIICRLSDKRRVTVQDFRGKTLVSIREYYEKEGKQLPSSKGISLSVEQWEVFAKAAPAVEEAIKKMCSD
ncbi:RNA polymerase II transcriptional coactivator KELP [Platanthera guangdongensis]|uniref:RNA polymerase II transcriptional coactivator KELP n=1 Tax=Platanthera guangdongensis TaxID=2320717 RepID=A0ABR2M8E5_9ASPA